LYEALRRAILDGHLVADERLPSSRDLMHNLQLSRNTVVAALGQLTVEGYLVSRVGSATFVNSIGPSLARATPRPGRTKTSHYPPRASGSAPNFVHPTCWTTAVRAAMHHCFGPWPTICACFAPGKMALL